MRARDEIEWDKMGILLLPHHQLSTSRLLLQSLRRLSSDVRLSCSKYQINGKRRGEERGDRVYD
jgi:hypothetical protein